MNRILWGGMILVFTSVLSSGTFAQLECGVYNGACPNASYVNLFQMSGLTGAHASVDDSYPYKVCCTDPSVPLGTDCSGDVNITVLRLASASNAHVGDENAPYPIEVCFSAPAGSSLSCVFRTPDCMAGETCVVATSDSINAQVSDGCGDPAIPWRVCCSSSPALAVCGDGVQDPGEDCDPPDEANCPTLCQADCSCPDPVCGNNVQELGEECDGTDAVACPGLCQAGCTCPGVPNPDVLCDWDIRIHGDDAGGWEYNFTEVLVEDRTDYFVTPPGEVFSCMDSLIAYESATGLSTYDMPFDIFLKSFEGDLEAMRLTVAAGDIDSVGPTLRITVPLGAGGTNPLSGDSVPLEDVGNLYMKILDTSDSALTVTVSANKVEGPSLPGEIILSGDFLLIPSVGYSLCPVCNVEDVPYLVYHAGYTPGPGMDVEETCEEANAVIEKLKSDDYCGGGGCPPESLVYLGMAERYYAVGFDILSGASSQSLLEQADRYCLEAGTFARDGIYALCARIGNPPGCT